MLHPADAFFRHGKHKLPVAHQARRRIMHLRIVNPQCDHAVFECPLYCVVGLRVSPNDKKRMSLFDNRPLRGPTAPKNPVHKLNRSVVPCRPTALKQSRVVKNHDSAWLDEPAPIVPIALHRRVGVISVDQKQVDFSFPAFRRILTELLDPHRCSS